MMYRSRACRGGLAALLGCCAAVGDLRSAGAAEPPAAVIVFDGSASMWGNPTGEKKSKLLLAREAFRAGFEKTPAGVRLGLVSFGHRRSGDCNDVEVQAKPAPGSAARINAILENYNPRGRGPITQALRAAAKELGPGPAPASVILVHDDPDNCQADPCAALADLQKAHPKVVVHVVSLAMKREDAQRMMCLTRPTGGTLAEAGNAQQINAAIEAALKLASASAATPDVPEAAAIPPPPPSGKTGLQLFAKLSAEGAAISNPLRWRVRAAGQSSNPLLHESDAVVAFTELPPGRYDIEAQYGFVVARSTVDVVAGKVAPVTISLGAGSVQLLDPATPAAMLRDAIVTFTRVQPQPETVSMLRGFVPEIALAPGSYIVAITSGPQRVERAVVVKAGERVKIEPLIAVGELDLQVAAAAGGLPLDGARTTVFEDDPDAPQGRREIARSAASHPVFTLLAGSYYVVAQYGGGEIRERFVIRAGERTERTLALGIAQVTVSAKLPGRLDAGAPIQLKLQAAEGAKEIVPARRGTATFDVPAGRYRLEGRIGTGNVQIEKDFELKAGAREQIALELPAGGLKLRLMDTSGAPLADAAWEVRDRAGRLVWAGVESEARPLLLQGRYNVKAEVRNRRVVRDIEVRAGEVRAIDLTGQ